MYARREGARLVTRCAEGMPVPSMRARWEGLRRVTHASGSAARPDHHLGWDRDCGIGASSHGQHGGKRPAQEREEPKPQPVVDERSSDAGDGAGCDPTRCKPSASHERTELTCKARLAARL